MSNIRQSRMRRHAVLNRKGPRDWVGRGGMLGNLLERAGYLVLKGKIRSWI